MPHKFLAMPLGLWKMPKSVFAGLRNRALFEVASDLGKQLGSEEQNAKN